MNALTKLVITSMRGGADENQDLAVLVPDMRLINIQM